MLTHEEWKAEGARRFGEDMMCWRFVCPVCGYVATPAEWKAAGAPPGTWAFSCIGRWYPAGSVRPALEGTGPGPCTYAGGGLFKLNPVEVGEWPGPGNEGKTVSMFAFAEPPP